MTEWEISRIRVGHRFRTDLGDIEGFSRSLADVGLLHPVVVTTDGDLIAGERRLNAAKKLGWKTVPVREINIEEEIQRLRAQRDENVVRKPFLPTEAAALAKLIEVRIQKEAAADRKAEGQKEGGKTAGRGRPIASVESFHTSKAPVRASELAAKGTGYSERTLRKVHEVVEAGAKFHRGAPKERLVESSVNLSPKVLKRGRPSGSREGRRERAKETPCGNFPQGVCRRLGDLQTKEGAYGEGQGAVTRKTPLRELPARGFPAKTRRPVPRQPSSR